MPDAPGRIRQPRAISDSAVPASRACERCPAKPRRSWASLACPRREMRLGTGANTREENIRRRPSVPHLLAGVPRITLPCRAFALPSRSAARRAGGAGGLLTPGVIPPHHPGSGPRLQTHAVLVNAASVQTHADAPPSRVGPTDAHPVRKAGTSHARGAHGRRGPEGAGPYVLHLERLDLAARQAVGRRDDGRGGDAGEGVRGGGGGKEGRQKAPARRAA